MITLLLLLNAVVIYMKLFEFLMELHVTNKVVIYYVCIEEIIQKIYIFN